VSRLWETKTQAIRSLAGFGAFYRLWFGLCRRTVDPARAAHCASKKCSTGLQGFSSALAWWHPELPFLGIEAFQNPGVRGAQVADTNFQPRNPPPVRPAPRKEAVVQAWEPQAKQFQRNEDNPCDCA